MIILSGLFILGIGIVGGYQLATLPKLIEMKQHKAIQNHLKEMSTPIIKKTVKITFYPWKIQNIELNFPRTPR